MGFLGECLDIYFVLSCCINDLKTAILKSKSALLTKIQVLPYMSIEVLWIELFSSEIFDLTKQKIVFVKLDFKSLNSKTLFTYF